jgi:hypothetical protein
MDELDHEAEQVFVTQAALGNDVRLGRSSDQRTLARWCCLIGMLFDQTQKKPLLTTEEHATLYRGDIPPRTQIWLLHTNPPALWNEAWGTTRTWELRHHSDPEAPFEAYFVTFGVNHLVAQVFIPPKGLPSLAMSQEWMRPFVRHLWPPSVEAFRWPAPSSMPWKLLPDLAEAFQTPKVPD